MRRVEQRIIRIISRSLINRRLILQLCRDGQVRAAIGNGIFIQQDRRRQRLDRIRDVLVVPGRVRGGPGDLADFDPQLGVLDVCGGFVVAG